MVVPISTPQTGLKFPRPHRRVGLFLCQRPHRGRELHQGALVGQPAEDDVDDPGGPAGNGLDACRTLCNGTHLFPAARQRRPERPLSRYQFLPPRRFGHSFRLLGQFCVLLGRFDPETTRQASRYKRLGNLPFGKCGLQGPFDGHAEPNSHRAEAKGRDSLRSLERKSRPNVIVRAPLPDKQEQITGRGFEVLRGARTSRLLRPTALTAPAIDVNCS
jgi:hypothetical protein